jgi:hypothetical protein
MLDDESNLGRRKKIQHTCNRRSNTRPRSQYFTVYAPVVCLNPLSISATSSKQLELNRDRGIAPPRLG